MGDAYECKAIDYEVPGKTSFEKFVKVKNGNNQNEEPKDYCIDLFEKAREVFGYDLPYKFRPQFGTYDDLVPCVHNKVMNGNSFN